jgi:hypothetical protein
MKAPNVRWQRITPAQAAKILRDQNTLNRDPSHPKVKQWADDMAGGLWNEELASPIKFDKEGLLFDGQHRLMALVKAGERGVKSILFLVIEGVPRSAIHVQDIGVPRTLKSAIALDPELSDYTKRNASHFNTIAAMLLRWSPTATTIVKNDDTRTYFLPDVSIARQREFIAQYADVLDVAAGPARKVGAKPLKWVVSASGALYVRLLENNVDQFLVNEFFEQVLTGAVDDTSNPARKFREMLIRRSIAGERTMYVKNTEMLRAGIEAWNYWATGVAGPKRQKLFGSETNAPALYVGPVNRRWVRKAVALAPA